ncbi:hypothetical protein FB562_2213 [Homoserinimonas aerilata]|uniref:Uncharacterized protein n=1 Tax=Homoserinimonas aerilata TaxID=1162970 RepID=A0A542YF25_9MICO|nr:hypothetical protein [Homoserinimonas aerilata]TQL46689.1 hypothetical protein FB562_2213 [Homoserinimonas aerilata]
MNTKTVTVTLPVTVWGRLASIADKQGVRVADVLAHAVAAEVTAPTFAPGGKTKTPNLDDPVVRHWKDGLTDREICAVLGMTRAAVGDKRRSFGLPANKKAGK